MNRLILAAALAAGCTLASSAPALAAAKNYDCTKAANANKAACKGAARPATARAAQKAPPAKAAATTTKSVTRTYDCTKAGNANKVQCKSSSKSSTTVATSVSKPAPAARPAPAPAQPSMFQRMKNAMTGSSSAPAPAAKRAPAPRKTAAAPASVEDHNPAGAIAQCKDGTYSHSKGRTGACSRHGGVAKWS